MKAGTERETRQGMFLFRSLNHVFYVWFLMIHKKRLLRRTEGVAPYFSVNIL